MEITGRLTGDATLHTLKDDRQVVHFSIAINDQYRAKDGDKKQVVTYVNCSYWISSKVAGSLKKGTIVSLYGRIGVNAYTNLDGEAVGSLTFHVNSIRFVASVGKPNGSPATTAKAPAAAETAADLPF